MNKFRHQTNSISILVCEIKFRVRVNVRPISSQINVDYYQYVIKSIMFVRIELIFSNKVMHN